MPAYAQSSEFKADPSKPISACTWHREPSAAAGKQSTIAIEQIFKCLDCVSFVNCLGTSGDTGLAASSEFDTYEVAAHRYFDLAAS